MDSSIRALPVTATNQNYDSINIGKDPISPMSVNPNELYTFKKQVIGSDVKPHAPMHTEKKKIKSVIE